MVLIRRKQGGCAKVSILMTGQASDISEFPRNVVDSCVRSESLVPAIALFSGIYKLLNRPNNRPTNCRNC